MKREVFNLKASKCAVYMLGGAALLAGATACEDENGTGNGNVVKEWNISLSGDLEVPSNNRSETGAAHLTLYSDNTLEYEISIDDLAAGDELTMAHVHKGDPVTSGPVAITIVDGESRTFTGNTASGSLILPQEEVDILTGDSIYFNVHSTQAGSGLARGQMDQEIVFADDVSLSSNNVAGGSAAIGDASGRAYLRLTSDGKLFYKVSEVEIDNPADAITEGSIYRGAAGEEGEFLQDLSFSQENVDQTRSITLNTSTVQTLTGEDTYLQLHSQLAPDGLMRGQIDRD